MSDIRKDIERISRDVEKLKCCTTTGTVNGGNSCCPETNNLLTNIKTDLESVIETCNDIIITSNTQIQRPVSAQNSGLYCDLIGCGCESATGSNDLDYIGQINLVSGTTVEFNSVSPDGEPVDTWELKILDISNNVQTTFSGTNIDYNNPLGSFDLGGINIGFYYDFVVNYVSGLASQSKGYFKINQDTTTVEHRYAILNTLFDTCENIVLNQNIRLDNPDINTSTQGTGVTTNETNTIQLNSFNVPQNATTPDIYLDTVLVPFNASGTKTISITFTFQDGIIISYTFSKNVVHIIQVLESATQFPNIENTYDGDTQTTWTLSGGGINGNTVYEVDWSLPLSIPNCTNNTPAENLDLKFFIDIEEFDGSNQNSGFIIAVTDGTTIYGYINEIQLGINQIPVTTPIPENGLPNLKIWLAELGCDFVIREVYAEINYTCNISEPHEVVAVSLKCLPENGLPVEVKNNVNFDKTGLATENTLTSIVDRINYLINQPHNYHTGITKATLINGGKTFGYCRNHYVYEDGSLTAQALEFSLDGANWTVPNINSYTLGWDFNDEDEIILTAGNSYTIQPNTVHSYSIVVTGTGTSSYYTLNGGTPISIKDGYSKKVTFEIYNNQQIDIHCGLGDEIRILKQW